MVTSAVNYFMLIKTLPTQSLIWDSKTTLRERGNYVIPLQDSGKVKDHEASEWQSQDLYPVVVTLRPKFRAGYHDTLTPVISVKRPRQLPNSDLPKMQAEGQTRRRALRMPTQKTKGCYSCQTTQVFSEICALDFVGTRIGKVWEYTPLIASLPTNPSPLTLEWWSLLCWRCWVPCRCS